MEQKKKKGARRKRRKKKEGEVQTRRTTSAGGQTIVVWQEPGGEPAPAGLTPSCLDLHEVRRLVEEEPTQGA